MSELRSVLELPEAVHKSDFVVKLVDGVAHPDALLRNYAVTPGIAGAYGAALTLVKRALDESDSLGSYVHGSFGAGKSHFMAVLSTILAGAPQPWDEPALHTVLSDHDWVKRRKLLRLHVHMLGADSIEQRVFGAYLAGMAEGHPAVPMAPLFEDQGLFDNAQQLREGIGDDAFFAKLNSEAGGGAKAGWGKYGAAATWDAASFDAARTSRAPDERARLFDALVRTLFSAFTGMERRYVDFDAGLAVMSEHAQRLGYEGIVLFLDELILWLAGRATQGEGSWLRTESEKVSKLVEATARRQIPIVSFVARQRDLVEFVGEELAGAHAAALRSSLDFQSGRFGVIRLDDTNLPAIVKKRVVRPKGEEGTKAIDAAFARLRAQLGGPAWETLRGSMTEDDFRQVYPFSPALLDALVALSNFLQRERTALKVLMEMLVGHLEDFRLGGVVGVGDLFDLVADGEEVLDGTMKARVDAARRLYEHELLHLIRTENSTNTKEQCQRLGDNPSIRLGCANCPRTLCRADNRFLKTMLLASLTPQVPLFRDLTVSRLLHLNHGALTSPIPGNEFSDATARLRKYAAQLGKVRIGDQKDPAVHVVLDSVNVRPILDSARGADSEQARRRKLRGLLVGEGGFGLEGDAAVHQFSVTWRGSKRTGEIVFGNVREMDVPQLRAPDGHDFRVVVDYPVDAPGHGPAEDLARIEAYLDQGPPSMTLVWVPSFFGETLQRELGELVVIDEVLEHPRKYLDVLPAKDQRDARSELENLRAQKLQAVRRALATAYGVSATAKDALDPTRIVDDHLHALWPALRLQRPPVASLADGLRRGIEQLFEERFPRHPRLGDTPVTRPKLEAALERFRQVCEADGQRVPIQRGEQKDFAVADALGLLNVTEAAVTLRLERIQQVTQDLAKHGIVQPTVERVKEAWGTAEMGVQREVGDFLVLAWATASGRDLVRGGAPLREPTMGKLPGDAELVQLPLPAMTDWRKALDLTGELFGIALGGKALNGRNLAAFAARVGERRGEVRRAGHIAEALLARQDFFTGDPPRLVTARKIAELDDRLQHDDSVALVASLSELQPATSAAAMAAQIKAADATLETLQNEVYFNTIAALRGRQEPAAAETLGEVRRALEADQVAEDLRPRIHELVLRAQALTRKAEPQPPPPPPGVQTVGRGAGRSMAEFEAAVDEVRRTAQPGDEVSFTWEIRRKS